MADSRTPPHQLFETGVGLYDLLPVPTHPKVLRAALSGVGGPLLDLGGGTGKYTVRYAPPGVDTILADPSRAMLQRAHRKRRPVAAVQVVGQRLPFGTDSFGAITITEAFHHFVPDQWTVLAECARVLRPEGILVIEEPDPDRLLGRLMAWGERTQRLGSEFHSAKRLSHAARRHFADVTHRRASLGTYLLVARSPQTL